MTSEEKLAAVIRHIPIDYLRAHDVPGATGPTDSLDVVSAMRDYSEDRWSVLARLAKFKAERDALLKALERVADAYCFDPSIDSSIWHDVFTAISLAKGESA